MSKIIHNLELGLDEDLKEKLQWLEPNYSGFHILKESLDARRRREAPRLVYSVEVFAAGEPVRTSEFHLDRLPEGVAQKEPAVLIVGSGPAGLFAALRLVERGLKVILFEQGSDCNRRLKAINRFWRYGELDRLNNIGFGEGGAGLYSDGKLITRIKSPHIPYVMDRLVRFGAPDEIRYLANPHVGSDKIRRLIPVMREYLLQNGATIHFDTEITEILAPGGRIKGVRSRDGREFSGERLILACGHSAEGMFHHLHQLGVQMTGKSFAVGLRIEHPQKVINQIQYRDYAEHPRLGAANYKLAHTDDRTKVGVYSFCMCPGGYVLSSATDHQLMVANGMSNYHRNSPFANAAVVVSIDYKKTFGDDLFAGLKWRREIEHAAYQQVIAGGGTKQMPVQRVEDFMARRASKLALPSSTPSGVIATRLDQLFPESMNRALDDGLKKFDHWMNGFIHPEAQFHGVESRTSCPIRIDRDKETYQSLSHQGLYPAGEGAGYAGGITSAACDGIAIADRIFTEVSSQIVVG